MNLAERRAAALDTLRHRTPPVDQRYAGETRPSGDMPEDPWDAARYLAERYDEEPADEQAFRNLHGLTPAKPVDRITVKGGYL